MRLRRRKVAARSSPAATRYAVLLAPGSKERVFAKVYAQDVRNEFDRGQALFEHGPSSGHFQAPRPLTLVQAHQLVLWEYQDGLIESRDFLISSFGSSEPAAARVEFFLSAGRALASVHSALGSLPNRGAYHPLRGDRAPFAELNRHASNALAATTLVAPHWDFACGNLFVNSGGAPGPLWVLDPMPNFYMMPEYFSVPGFGSNLVGSPYVDAAQLIFSVRSHPRFSGWAMTEHSAYLDAFLNGYREAGGASLDPAVVLACAGEVTLMYQDLLDRDSRRRSMTDRLDRRSRLWSAQQLFADAMARLDA
jgi:hypothetical protein